MTDIQISSQGKNRSTSVDNAQKKENFPWSPKAAHEFFAKAAGLDEAVVGNAAAQAWKVAIDMLGATKSEIVSYQGEVTRVLEFADNSSRLTAMKFLLEFAQRYAGLTGKENGSSSSDAKTGPVNVVIKMASTGQVQVSEPKNVTPSPGDES